MWTPIRLLLEQQSDRCPHCFLQRLFKTTNRLTLSRRQLVRISSRIVSLVCGIISSSKFIWSSVRGDMTKYDHMYKSCCLRKNCLLGYTIMYCLIFVMKFKFQWHFVIREIQVCQSKATFVCFFIFPGTTFKYFVYS